MSDEPDLREERIDDEAPRDPAIEARRAAALSLLTLYGDPILRSRATAVDRFDDTLGDQVRRMGAIMGDALGVGLAAPQLGLSQRLLVYRVGPEARLVALLNPEVEWTSAADVETLDEGCLSIPGIAVEVERPVHVRIRAQDEEGGDRVIEASGLEARVIQHEVDHLDGILFVDRVEDRSTLREVTDEEADDLELNE